MSTVATSPHDSALRRILIAIFLFSATSFGSAMAAITVGPDSDPSCDYHHVGSAVAAAVQNPGLDLVQISTGTYSGMSTLAVTGSDGLIIEGGFANCSAGLSTDMSTLDGAGAAAPGSIITHFGTGTLRLLHLTLTHGDSGGGGGINSQGSGELVLSDVSLYLNHAQYGGGLYVAGGLNAPKYVTLHGIRVNSNVADASGGGIYAVNAHISIGAIGGTRPSYFLGNQAQGEVADSGDGGAIYALNSTVLVHTSSVYPFIGSNHAERSGGGIYFGTNDYGAYSYSLNMENRLADYPLLISDNSAMTGGALYVKAESDEYRTLYVRLTNTRIEDNTALFGAAIYSESNATGTNQVFTNIAMSRSDVDQAWSTAPPCTPGVACNSISGNHAFQSQVVAAKSYGTAASAQFGIWRGEVRDNIVDNGPLIGGYGATVVIDTSLIADNVASMVAAVDGRSLTIANSTVANNNIAAPYLFNLAFQPAALYLRNSMLHDAVGIGAYNVGANVPVTVRNIGASNVGVTGTNVQHLLEPFVDLANGDYHLRITSSAVDRWVPGSAEVGPDIDLDGAARPYTFNPTTTPYDFGAYEAGSVIDTIFRNGFDPHEI